MRSAYWRLRLTLKWCALRLHLTVIEYCDDCGVRQPLIWTASDALWHEVTGRESVLADGGGVYCPACFDRKAREKHMLIRWVPVLEYRDHERVESHDQYMKLLTGKL